MAQKWHSSANFSCCAFCVGTVGSARIFFEHDVHKGLRWSEVVAETTEKVDAMQRSSTGFHSCRGFRAQMFLQVIGGLNKVVQSET